MKSNLCATVCSPGRMWLASKEFANDDEAWGYIARMRQIYGTHFNYGWR